jgi:hypothetical protein
MHARSSLTLQRGAGGVVGFAHHQGEQVGAAAQEEGVRVLQQLGAGAAAAATATTAAATGLRPRQLLETAGERVGAVGARPHGGHNLPLPSPIPAPSGPRSLVEAQLPREGREVGVLRSTTRTGEGGRWVCGVSDDPASGWRTVRAQLSQAHTLKCSGRTSRVNSSTLCMMKVVPSSFQETRCACASDMIMRYSDCTNWGSGRPPARSRPRRAPPPPPPPAPPVAPLSALDSDPLVNMAPLRSTDDVPCYAVVRLGRLRSTARGREERSRYARSRRPIRSRQPIEARQSNRQRPAWGRGTR